MDLDPDNGHTGEQHALLAELWFNTIEALPQRQRGEHRLERVARAPFGRAELDDLRRVQFVLSEVPVAAARRDRD